MMDQEADKKKRTQLKEARIAFLEEEVPGLVAKGASLGESCGTAAVQWRYSDDCGTIAALSGAPGVRLPGGQGRQRPG